MVTGTEIAGHAWNGMGERLAVKNFLCLKEVDLEVKDFLILIGPQASGKSVCAKLLYFFRTMLSELVILLCESHDETKIDMSGTFGTKFKEYFPQSTWENQEFEIRYMEDARVLSVVHKDKTLSIDFGSAEALNFYITSALSYKQREVNSLLQNVLLAGNDFFIPAGRSFFSQIQKGIYTILSAGNDIDPFIKRFGVLFENAKRIHASITNSNQVIRDAIDKASSIVYSVIKGEYQPQDNTILMEDGRTVSLFTTSSGQQEAVPLVLYLSGLLRSSQASHINIYIEEPETHLFPDAQEQIARLISLVQRNAASKPGFVITTHSPYMLTAFNNLIEAGNIVKQYPERKEAVCELIPETMHINIDRFSAYLLSRGKARSIIDEENNLVNGDAIDEVSETIGETYDKLLDIEFAGAEYCKNA
jgi:ABC-type cobalamin/Fe3+-siderophores transport system ATPase subunit